MYNYNVYVGYYEVFITKHTFPQYALSSRHKTAENATNRVERDYPSASVYYDAEAYEEYFGDCPFYWDDERKPLFTMEDEKGEKVNFYE